MSPEVVVLVCAAIGLIGITWLRNELRWRRAASAAMAARPREMVAGDLACYAIDAPWVDRCTIVIDGAAVVVQRFSTGRLVATAAKHHDVASDPLRSLFVSAWTPAALFRELPHAIATLRTARAEKPAAVAGGAA